MNKLTQDIKIVFFDIDDTLYDKNKACFPKSITDTVLPKLKEKGIIPAIATGRCLGAFPNLVRTLLNKGDIEILVTINGQHNSYRSNVISDYPFKTERIDAIVQQLKQHHIDYAFVSHDNIVVSSDFPEINHALTPIKKDYIIGADYYKTNKIFQMLLFYPETKQVIIDECGLLGDDLKVLRWHENSVDLLNKQNSKARGISDVLRYLNLDAKQAMAFGDGFNDLEMLSHVGCGVAMGNAVDALKAQADFVTLPIHEDGILYALEKLNVI